MQQFCEAYYSADLDKKLYEKLTRIKNSPLADAFFDKENVDKIQDRLVKGTNYLIQRSHPGTKCEISRQSDREVMLLMVEFFYYHTTLLSTANFANMNDSKKKSIYNQVPVPAAFMFSDPGDSYIPGWFRNEDVPRNVNGNCNATDRFNQLEKINSNTIPQRCVGDKHYYTDNPVFNPAVPIPTKVKLLNDKFVDFLVPKIMYEIRNKLKYDYFTYDPYACFVDYPSYETSRKDKALPLSSYYSGKTERYFPDYAKEDTNLISNAPFPKLKGEWTRDKYNCVQARSLDREMVNPEVLYGETDILFDSRKIKARDRARRQMIPGQSKYFSNVQIPVLPAVRK